MVIIFAHHKLQIVVFSWELSKLQNNTNTHIKTFKSAQEQIKKRDLEALV